jgi:rubrerythrin
MAEQIERNGAAFYRKASHQALGADRGRLLQKLAAMEDVHEMTFRALRKSLVGDEMFQTLLSPDDDALKYLHAWVNQHVFCAGADPTMTIGDDSTMEDILQTAITIEKDSIAFYVGIKEMVPVDKGRGKIDLIIQEEMNHITSLIQELLELEQS